METSAAFTLVALATEVAAGDTVTHFGGATAGRIGHGSGIDGVNLSIEIAGGTCVDGSFSGNDEVFADAEGFGSSFSSNSFTCPNFSDGLALAN